MAYLTFPPSFVWGTATSAYQIEGGWNQDGKGESIWDRFSHTPGRIEDDSTGDTACNHYEVWPQDIALMKSLGLNAYRFSIAWSRILPEGRGQVNQAGLDFYSRLVDGLLEAGIAPCATLYHWDLPQRLQDEGGWPARATAEAFVEYTDTISRQLGDRVRWWITHNEPWCAAFLGYLIGEHAPGWKEWPAALQSSHHLLLSHGWAVPVIRRNAPGAQVGITLNFTPAEPASPSQADREATRHFDGFFQRWFLDPLYGRHYPADMVADYIRAGHLPAEGMTFVREGDLEAIAVPTDFLGLNYYTRAILRDQEAADNLPPTLTSPPDAEWTEMVWEVHPESLYRLLNRLHFEYSPPRLYITENGASYSDGPNGDGRVHDVRRVRYLQGHLAAAHRALENGVPLAGYFVWSFLDNFEWAKGYLQRFGMVWVDYESQQRIPKDSALWYARVIAANGFDATLEAHEALEAATSGF